jgi:pyrroline-5-carboxylate reductase
VADGVVRTALVGAGNLGSVMVRAALARQIVTTKGLAIVNRTAAKATALAEALGCDHYAPEELPAWRPECVLLAVKPRDVVDGAALVRSALQDGGVVISVLAGVTTARLRELVGPGISIVRAMPNVASLYGTGVTAWYIEEALHPTQEEWCRRLFEALGVAFKVSAESRIDVATAVFASSPAFILYVIEQLESHVDGLGLTPGEGRHLLAQLLRGCASLVESSRPLPETRASIVSPGGTTAAGLGVLAEGHLGSIFRDAIGRSIERAEELSRSY